MGRGRAKAKQTKVARELKYFSPDTDLSALERELHGQSGSSRQETHESDYSDYEDPYAEDDDADDGYGSWVSGSGR